MAKAASGKRRLLRWLPAVAAVVLLAVALGFWLAAFGITFDWLGGAGLGALVVIEFLVIHGFPFVVAAAMFARHTTGWNRLLASGALGVLIVLYPAIAWKAGDGVWGVIGLLYLMAPNVLAFLGAHDGGTTRVLVTSRWVIKFGMLMLIAAMIGDGSLEGPAVLWIGAVYFTLLAGVELYRVVEIPGELVRDRGIELPAWVSAATGHRAVVAEVLGEELLIVPVFEGGVLETRALRARSDALAAVLDGLSWAASEALRDDWPWLLAWLGGRPSGKLLALGPGEQPGALLEALGEVRRGHATTAARAGGR